LNKQFELHKFPMNWRLFQWIMAFISTLGSLFFSEVMKLPPCVLCWYQRIFMYPLVFILTVGILRQDRNLQAYIQPLVVMGAAFAFYHNLLYYNVIPESFSPCVQGISCTSRQIEWFGFITIPLLSLLAFLFIALLGYFEWKKEKTI